MTQRYVSGLEIPAWLDMLIALNLPFVKRHLRQGDLVSLKSYATTDYWEVDNPSIHQQLPGFNTDKISLEAAYNAFPRGRVFRDHLFEAGAETKKTEGDVAFTYRFMPFSRAIEAGAGVCLERSTLLQLSQQGSRPSYLIFGFGDFGDVADYHAWNIVVQDGSVLLADVKPYRKVRNDGKYRSYLVPIQHIDTMTGDISLASELADGRSYSMRWVNEREELYRFWLPDANG